MAASVHAAQCGRRVGLVDDNPNLGGQIWRSETAGGASDRARWVERCSNAGVEALCGTRVFHNPAPGGLLAEREEDIYELSFQKLVLATGARERFLPFPGWTLPNVMGAGGLEAMVKSGLPIEGKRVVVAGTGPLLLAVAAWLRMQGAIVLAICEQARWGSLLRLGGALLLETQKLAQALSLRRQLAGVRFLTSCWPIKAQGEEKLQAVVISRGERIACDYLACGFHLVPSTELAQLLGCQIRGGSVEVDEFQETSLSGVFCAGEPTGIGGLELSLIEGQIAGLAAADSREHAARLFRQRKKLARFASALDRAFCLRQELKTLARPETIVCRCEDVSHRRLAVQKSWRSAKLQTRCGMGPCQGRICGPATEFLFHWKPDSVRPPIFPAQLEHMAWMASHPESDPQAVLGGDS
jgi:NADPH-dependent 2,4-dienoyl-CoA reductase/sulfur reductase-like enzyme